MSVLEVPHFATLVYKSTKQFDLSFIYDAAKIWNDLPVSGCYPTALVGCRGIVFTHGVRMGGRPGGRAGGGKKFVRAVSQKP